jgi:transposase
VPPTARRACISLRALGRTAVPEETRDLLESIPGIGPVLGAAIASEIGDIGRFPSAKALVAYAGLDPRVRQSGTSLCRNTRITKRGSPHLRHALYLAATIGQQREPGLKAYYEKKRAEGRHYTAVTVANARHIACRVYAVLKRGKPYDDRTLSTSFD